MYSSNSRRLTSFFVPTKRTKGQLGAFSMLSILLMPMLLYSAASLVVSAIFRWMGTVGVLVMRVLLSWRLCRQIEPVFFVFEGNRIAPPEVRCGRRWYCWPFGALFVYAGSAFPCGVRLLPAVDFCPAGAGEKAPAADRAAVQLRGDGGLVGMIVMQGIHSGSPFSFEKVWRFVAVGALAQNSPFTSQRTK